MARQRGFSLLELVVCIALITGLASIAYSRLSQLAEDAEHAAFQGVVGWLQAGVNLEFSHALAQGRLADMQQLERYNPMLLADKVVQRPSNYLGELSEAQAEQAPAGHWFFVLGRGELVYRSRYRGGFSRYQPDERGDIRFRLKLLRAAADSLGKRAVRGVALERIAVETD